VWLLKAALPTFNRNEEGGHFLLTGSIAVYLPPFKINSGDGADGKFDGIFT
jgi:hypothetical protein